MTPREILAFHFGYYYCRDNGYLKQDVADMIIKISDQLKYPREDLVKLLDEFEKSCEGMEKYLNFTGIIY